jgi:diaminohydroxyphosphoribosylaminopyrimidine deaminase/5-amino-6-(5-phosphoribosylamino)uracil reductase
MQPEMDDRRFMALALALGRRGLGRVWPNPAVGAVVVRREPSGPVVVGRGWTQPGGRPHAETEALRRAGAAARGATLYVTLEPCSHHGKTPPCADAVIAAGIARVVAAIEDPNPEVAGKGFARLKAAGIAVEVGLGAPEAQRDHAGFLRRIADGRPHVTLKLAVTADDKAGGPGRRPLAITGAPARERAHLMRAQNDAILVGIGTVLADDPELTCRLPGMAPRSPVRVVLDGQLRLPLSSRLVAGARAVPLWVMTASDAPIAAEQALRQQGVEVVRVGKRHGGLDLAEILARLGERGLTRLLVEGGPIVAASFLADGLVDEAVLMRSSRAIGAGAIDALEGLPLSVLTDGPQFARFAVEPVGDDTVELFARV